MLLGNVMIEPYLQIPSIYDYFQKHKFSISLSTNKKAKLNLCFKFCRESVRQTGFKGENLCNKCTDMLHNFVINDFGLNLHDITKRCFIEKPNPYNSNTISNCKDKTCDNSTASNCYNNTDIEYFLNSEDVKNILNIPKNKTWTLCKKDIKKSLQTVFFNDMSQKIVNALQHGLKLLVYFGERDLITNWKGGLKLVENINWNGAKNFKKNEFVLNKNYGFTKKYKNLEFVKFLKAGSYVGMDRPKATLDMVIDFLGIPKDDALNELLTKQKSD